MFMCKDLAWIRALLNQETNKQTKTNLEGFLRTQKISSTKASNFICIFVSQKIYFYNKTNQNVIGTLKTDA